ncbi:MAG TPA: VWA domain-containing protein [Thermoanaerobaculia bacterium]|nr:VWA domain-containing protein [Thermoanaerobaculia bacterium]
MKRARLGLAGLVLALAGLPATAQSPPANPQPAQDAPTYSEEVGTEYVLLPVLVFDKKGRFVDGLAKKDFRVRVDTTPVEIDEFERDDGAAVSMAFLVDTSGSMEIAGKLDHAKKAIRSIVQARLPGDDFALFAFSEGKVEIVADFSSDSAKLFRALDGLEAGGQTALFDAVAATPRLLKGRNAKRAILLFTDGVDNASKLDPTQMAEILQQVSTPVYAFGMKNVMYDLLSEEQRRELFVDNLKMLSASSGGQMYLVGDEDLGPLARNVNSEVRKQYILGFSPSGQGELKYRVVFVSVVKKGNWIVRTRRGYRGTAPTSTASR